MNSRRGQTILTVMVVVGIFILVYAFLASVMNVQIASAQDLNAMEAFFLNNLHLFIGIGLSLFVLRALGGTRR